MASKRNGIRNLEAFPLDNKMTKPQRVAALLDWWAGKYNYDFLGYNEITKAVNGYKHMPRMENQEVTDMRSIVGRAAKILQEKYKRGLVRHWALGARATAEDMDTIRNNVAAAARRHERSGVALVKLVDIVNVKNIPDTPENRPHRQWVQRDIMGIVKQLSEPNYMARLLPPKKKEEEV